MLESVLSQNYPDLELMVFDAGSTDETLDVLKRYGKHLSYWESVPDNGQSHAINKGLLRSSGELENWLNSDDELADGALHLLNELNHEHPGYDIYLGQREVIDVASRVIAYHHYNPSKLHADMLSYLFYPAQECTFWRSALRKRVGLLREDLHYSMDYDWYLRLSQKGKALTTPAVLGCIRSHQQQKGNCRDESGETLLSVRDQFIQSSYRWPLLVKAYIRAFRLYTGVVGKSSPFSWTLPDASR